ncbi:MAG TPA: pseudouridine synthase [Bacteroidota bacterium]|nr:pseudouridine synthase [Bacteroidota bacterium]
MAPLRNRIIRRVSLARALSKLGAASRAEGARMIESGRVTLNGRIVSNPAVRCAPEVDVIRLDGKEAIKPAREYIMLHKPKGVVTTRSDEKGRKTVYDLLDIVRGWYFPVGRLDMDSSGLLLLTNDNRLGELLTNPRSGIPKTYIVKLDRKMRDEDVSTMRRGLSVDGETFLPAKVRLLDGTSAEIIIHEGKNRQIRRMCDALGYKVIELMRTRIGRLSLGNLPPGHWRKLSAEDLQLVTSEPRREKA